MKLSVIPTTHLVTSMINLKILQMDTLSWCLSERLCALWWHTLDVDREDLGVVDESFQFPTGWVVMPALETLPAFWICIDTFVKDTMALTSKIENLLISRRQIIDNLVRKTQYKLHALRCIGKFLTLEKAKIVGNTFIGSQFNYTPLIWMFCTKTFYSKTEKIRHFKSDLWYRWFLQQPFITQ